MFKKLPYKRLKLVVFTAVFGLFFSCKEETTLVFSEINLLEKTDTTVEINIPEAKGNSNSSKLINTALQNLVTKALNIDSSKEIKPTMKEAILQFNSSFKKFKDQMVLELQIELTPWEAVIDGEVNYNSSSLTSISISNYMNTGGAHGSLKVSFLNFNTRTGKQLFKTDLIKDLPAFKKFIYPYFEKKIGSVSFDDLKIPETIGFNDEGIIILYNKNEIPSATDQMQEFTIPFEDVNKHLKTNVY